MQNYGYKKLVATLLILVIMSLQYVMADEVSDLKKQENSSSNKINEIKTVIEDKKNEIETITSQMQKIDAKIDSTNEELENYKKDLTVLAENIDNTIADLNIKIEEQNVRQEKFEKRLVAIYKQGDVSYLDVILASTSITDFLIRFKMLSAIAEQDESMLEELALEKTEIVNKKEKLEQEKLSVVELEKQTESKQQDLQKTLDAKSTIQNQLKTEKSAAEKMLQEEEKAAEEVANKIKSILAERARIERERIAKEKAAGKNPVSNEKYTGGIFKWPVPSSTTISSEFGYRIHPILKIKKFHTGIDISAPSGSKIIAAAKGTVILAGWNGAYGNAVVIDHGGGITTLYGHMSSIGVKVGANLAKGEYVGAVGSTGLSTGPHLHFEVSNNGNVISPWTYIN